ncbi:MAG TPA: thioredoxin domain-containing protein [Novosphingobium sp.]|nr:thioredoxin domain-containing protein [Novosphingobium sp.]
MTAPHFAPRFPALRLAGAVMLAALALPAAAHAAQPQPAAPAPAAPAPGKPPVRAPLRGGNWLGMATLSPTGGHVMGNPQAATRVSEYMSYTCPHCAHFEAEASLPLRMGYIASGRVSFEVKHLLRDPLDVTVALLVNCAPPARFFALHHQMLATQDKWLAMAQASTPAQRERWQNGPMPERLRAIASDLQLYDTVARFGIGRPAADRCLADPKLMERIVGHTREAEKLGIDSTPSFAINGQVAADVHDWRGLSGALSDQH